MDSNRRLGIDIEHTMLKYDPHALHKTINDVTIHISKERMFNRWDP